MKKTSLGHGTIYLTISTIVFVASAYLTNIILGRYLGPASYGIYGVIITLMTTINLTQTSGLPIAVAKFIAEDEDKADAILKTGLIIQIVSTAVVSVFVFIFAYSIASLFRDLTLVPYIQLSSIVFPLYGIYAIYTNYYNGLHFFQKQSLLNIVYAISKLVTVITLIYFFHVYGAILAFIISPIIALLFGLHFPKTVQTFPYKKLFLFSLPLIGSAIFGTLLQSIDLFSIKAILHSNKLTGFYTANQNIAEIPFFGITALASVLFPGISRSIRHESPDKTRRLIQNSLRFCLLIITPSVFLISSTSIQALAFLYSSIYNPGASSLSILAFGAGFFTVFTLLSTIMSASGYPIRAAALAGTGVLISLVSCILLIPSFGMQGAALATTIATGVILVISGVMVYRKFYVLFNLKSAVKILLASFLIYFLARIIPIPTLLLPLLYLFLFGIYVTLLFFLKEITDEDIRLVKSLMRFRK